MRAKNSANSGISSPIPGIPDQVVALFGDPPLLRGEDRSLYYTLMKHFTDLVEPNDMIEWWWVKDHYKGVDKLIASAELRRDHTLRETARRRETLAERPRKASDEIVDGEAVELPQAAE
jgi:hypothetical protein